MSNDPAFESAWAAAEAAREQLVATIRALSPELQRQGTSKALAPLAVIDHMRLAECYIEPMVRAHQGKPPHAPKPNFVFRWIINWSKSGKNMPTIAEMTPKELPDLEDAAARWADFRSAFRSVMESAPSDQALFRHPVLGWMGRMDVLELWIAHTAYHQRRLPG
jgi:hypothetical protein